jgi:phosphatidylserine/phosphatidylglycerophosphate/cardiolipin synthase-like enzyme
MKSPLSRYSVSRCAHAVIAFACVLVASGCRADTATRHAAPASEFQIVESVPEETTFGSIGVPRTKDVWLQMIRAARQQIDIAAFYIADKPGSGLSAVLDALAERAGAGVKVRVLVDRTFLKDNTTSVERLEKSPGIEVHVLPVDTLTGGVLHAKYMVIDTTRVFVGSQNWDWRALDQIHEIGAVIESPRLARTFDATFNFDWQLAVEPDLSKASKRANEPPSFAPVTEEDPVILNGDSSDPLIAFPAFSPPSLMPSWVTHEQPSLVQLIEASQHMLRIQVMTLSAIRQYGSKGWWPEVDAALRDAAARGVQIHIIVADWALREPMQSYLKSLAVIPGITLKFSQIPPSSKGFIPYARVEHAKYAVADDRAIYIGTGNWEWSYFNNTVDASIFVHGLGPARALTAIFDHDWDGTYVTTVRPEKTYEAPSNH